MADRLDDYLDLIERERNCRPAEAMLADEIRRLRALAEKKHEDLDMPGVPRLIEHLAAMTRRHMFLWYSGPPAGEDVRWRVWDGVPTGSGGGEWGRGPSAFVALQNAYQQVVRSIFDGRLPRAGDDA